MRDFWDFAQKLTNENTPFVVVTLVSARGHTPQDPGAKAIVSREGIAYGTVGGGKVEARAIGHSLGLIEKRVRTPELHTWNLQSDLGMTCGGEVTFLFEIHDAQMWSVALFGAGHVAQALARVLEPMQCQITCIDAREEWISRFPIDSKIRSICLAEPALAVQRFSSDTFFVVITQGHAMDTPILEKIFKTFPRPPYVGVIGSELKGRKILSELRERRVPEESLSLLKCPMGLELGNNHPQEIAVSIAAELIQTRDRLWK